MTEWYKNIANSLEKVYFINEKSFEKVRIIEGNMFKLKLFRNLKSGRTQAEKRKPLL